MCVRVCLCVCVGGGYTDIDVVNVVISIVKVDISQLLLCHEMM